MKNIMSRLILGFFGVLIGCMSVKKESKIKEALTLKLAEFNNEDFIVLEIDSRANEGDFNSSNYKAKLSVSSDSNIEFTLPFYYNKGEINIDTNSFYSLFSEAKRKTDKLYAADEILNSKLEFDYKYSYNEAYQGDKIFLVLFTDKQIIKDNAAGILESLKGVANKLLSNTKASTLKANFYFVSDLDSVTSRGKIYNGAGPKDEMFLYNSPLFNLEINLYSNGTSKVEFGFNVNNKIFVSKIKPSAVKAFKAKYGKNDYVEFVLNSEKISSFDNLQNVEWQPFYIKHRKNVGNGKYTEPINVAGEFNVYNYEVKFN